MAIVVSQMNGDNSLSHCVANVFDICDGVVTYSKFTFKGFAWPPRIRNSFVSCGLAAHDASEEARH